MFALDLFNTDHERRIAEGAVDQLEQRRIDDLAMKMDDLVTRAKKALTAEAKAALMKEFQKCKAERDSYYMVRNETMGYGSLGETGLPDVDNKAAKMARLKQPGKVETDVVTPQQRVNPNPDKGIVGHAVDWLRGKGGPGKEGPTYESKVDEGFGPLGSKALMNGNLATFMKARQARTPVTLDIGGEQFRLTPAIMDAMAKKYNDDKAAADSNPTDKDVKLIAINNYRAFGYPDIMRKFIDSIATPEATPPAGDPGEQLPMFEKNQQLQKKKSNNKPELNSSSVRDTKLSRALTKARGAYPTASSDIEALVRQELDTGERVKQDVGSIQTTNTAQDQTLTQLQKVNQQQTAQIAGLEKQLSTVVQQTQQPARVAPVPQTTPAVQPPVTVKSADIPIATDIPEPTTPRDQEIYNKVQSLEKELKSKIDAMASWNSIAQKDPQSNNELVDLRKEVARTRKELQTQINKLTKANKGPTMVKPVPKPKALPDPNVVDVDAWEIPDMGTAQELQPIAAREGTEKPTAIGQMAKNVGQGQELQQDPAYRSQVRRTQQQATQRQQNIAQQKAGYDNDPDDFKDIPDINEGAMKEIDIMRQDVERMNDRQFYTAYGISKAAFQQKYRTLLKPALDEGQGLHQGDPITVTAPNEFEGKTGEIHELSPSGKFVIVNLYNHGKHSMHLSDVAYNQYADDQEQDDWYDKELNEANVNPQFINAQVTKILAGEARRMTNAPMAQLLAPVMKEYSLTLKQIDSMIPGGLKKSAGDYGIMMKEGWSDAVVAQRTGRPRTPYSVYIKGKKWKDFENDDHARAVMDKLKAKFAADGRDPSVITIAPTDMSEDLATPPPEAPRPAIIAPAPAAKYMVKKPQAPRAQADDPAPRHAKGSIYSDDETTLKVYKPEQYREAANPAQQAAIAIAMKKAGKKPENVDETTAFLTHGPSLSYGDQAQHATLGPVQIEKTMTDGSVVVYCERDGKRYRTHSSALKPTVAETVTDVKAGMAKIYHKLAPKIKRHRDSFLAGQLYDELENYAELHGAEAEFKRIMIGARNRAHMDYDTNPGGFQNWFWYLPFDDEVNEGLMKDPTNRKEYLDQRDKLFRMMSLESNPANKQIIRQAIKELEARYGKIKDPIREEYSTSSEAVEIAIIRRILVAHVDLIMEFGLDKVTQAIEEIAYNVGDVDEIGTSDVSAYVDQVKQILGAK
jgi:hypothetical protein